ncbi:MAG: hypothetical protein WBW32_15545 [Luteibacter sp.]
MTIIRVYLNRALLIACCIFPFPSWVSAACYGGHPNVEAEQGTAKFVVLATVKKSRIIMSKEDPGFVDSTIYDVSVIKSYKGKPAKTLAITSVNTSTRFPMDTGETYLLFVRQYDGAYYVNSCGNSGTTSETADIIKSLDLHH